MTGAYVAFDLDNTLGFFELTNPLAYLWSPEHLSNPEQSAPNSPLTMSPRLRAKLRRARDWFASAVASNEELLWLILRPNLHAIFDPLVAAWRDGRVKAVVIYSNTSVTYSMELGKALIEHAWRAPGLIRAAADHWSPLRKADRSNHSEVAPVKYEEPLKTVQTLRALFRKAAAPTRRAQAGRPVPLIPLKRILFVDDRSPKHALSAQEAGGLTYLVPTHYVPPAAAASVATRQLLFALAIEAMNRAGLLRDREYLHSGFCHRHIPYDWSKLHPIRNCVDLLQWVWGEIETVELSHGRRAWKDDTAHLAEVTERFLQRQ